MNNPNDYCDTDATIDPKFTDESNQYLKGLGYE